MDPLSIASLVMCVCVCVSHEAMREQLIANAVHSCGAYRGAWGLES